MAKQIKDLIAELTARIARERLHDEGSAPAMMVRCVDVESLIAHVANAATPPDAA